MWLIYKHPKDGHYACVPEGSEAADRRRGTAVMSFNGTEQEAIYKCYELERKEHEEKRSENQTAAT